MFDIEEYRADLTRRRDVLDQMAEDAGREFARTGSNRDLMTEIRISAKAQGLTIALSLLPEPEEETK